MQTSESRRAVLGALGSACATGLAGCLGGDGGAPGGDATDGSGGGTDAGTGGGASATGASAGPPPTSTPGWSRYQSNVRNTGHTSAAGPTDGARVRWRTDAGGGYPAVADGTVYTFDVSAVVATDADSGEEVWRTDAAGDRLAITPTVAGGTVYAVTSADWGASYLHALDAETGERLWRFDPAETDYPPAVDGDTVYLGDWSGRVYAIDAGTGEERWRFVADNRGNTTPLLDDGAIYVLGESLYVVDAATGDLEREVGDLGGEATVVPTLADGVVYHSAGTDALRATDVETDEELWTTSFPAWTAGGVAVAGDRLFVGSSESNAFRALDTATGERRWQVSLSDATRTHPAVADGVVYAGTDDDVLYALDVETGDERWRQPADGVRAPAVVDGRVYVGGFELVALEAA